MEESEEILSVAAEEEVEVVLLSVVVALSTALALPTLEESCCGFAALKIGAAPCRVAAGFGAGDGVGVGAALTIGAGATATWGSVAVPDPPEVARTSPVTLIAITAKPPPAAIARPRSSSASTRSWAGQTSARCSAQPTCSKGQRTTSKAALPPSLTRQRTFASSARATPSAASGSLRGLALSPFIGVLLLSMPGFEVLSSLGRIAIVH